MEDNSTTRGIGARSSSAELKSGRRKGEVAALVRDFSPLVRKVAARYEGRGAEREDLVQEGFLFLVAAIRRYNKRTLAMKLASNLPGRVRDAAARMRRARALDAASLSEDEELDFAELQIPDERAQRDFDDFETADLLESLFEGADLEIARAAMCGLTQKEISEELDMSQQNVSYRLKGIREALRRNL
jgi:RNA polymerase sigma factor (sigma-70 family)